MSKIIYPRSPREEMCGWPHLPRFIDKIRLHLASQLPPDYQENFTKGFDGRWLAAAGLQGEAFIGVVRETITDGQVADWVRKNVKTSAADKAAFREFLLNHPKPDNAEGQARLKLRKEQSGMAHRTDVKTFIDYIDADEGRL